MKALVTGGAGFIGSHIAGTILRQGGTVRILDNMSSGREENLAACPGADFVRGDITSPDDTQKACQGCDTVFHHAALVSVQESIVHPERSFAVNASGTFNVLLAAREAGVKRLVFASSAAVYGDDPELPKREDMALTPISPYGSDKAAGEHYLTMACRLWGLETVVLRYFNVFGPRQDPNGDYAAVIPRFVSRLVSGQAPIIFGDGNQTRDFLFIDDVVAANLAAATHPAAPGGIFNVARGDAISLLSLLEILQRATGLTVQPDFQPERTGDIVHSAANTSKVKDALGFIPATSLEAGLAATAQYFQKK
jgi:nucleoside-diphosphate-sugar epimerase